MGSGPPGTGFPGKPPQTGNFPPERTFFPFRPGNVLFPVSGWKREIYPRNGKFRTFRVPTRNRGSGPKIWVRTGNPGSGTKVGLPGQNFVSGSTFFRYRPSGRKFPVPGRNLGSRSEIRKTTRRSPFSRFPTGNPDSDPEREFSVTTIGNGRATKILPPGRFFRSGREFFICNGNFCRAHRILPITVSQFELIFFLRRPKKNF